MSKEPSDRQIELAKYKAKHRRIPTNQAMIDVGYSKSYANSGQLKRTGSWQRLMKKYLPDKKLVKVIDDGLGANRVISTVTGKLATGGTTDFIEVPDHAVRHKFVETALKMKGKLVDRTDVTTNGNDLTPLLVKFIDNDAQSNNGDTS